MRANTSSFCAALLSVMLMGALVPAAAQKVAFDTPPAPREVKACVLDFGTQVMPNARLFVALQRAALRPQGWAFRNPLAPPDEEPPTPPDTDTDWLVLATDPAYWRVELDATGEEDVRWLAAMDFIYLPLNGNLDVPPGPARDGLLHAVENGAMLWIDYVGGSVADFAPPRVRAAEPGGASIPFVFTADPATQIVDRYAEMLRMPYLLEDWEIRAIGGDDRIVRRRQSDVDLRPLLLGRWEGPDLVGATAMATRYGSGTILVTAGNVGARATGWLGQVWPGDAHKPALKFAYNAVAWHFQTRQSAPAGGGPTAPLARAPVDIRWQYPSPDRAGVQFGPVFAPPLHFNGYVYVLTTRGDGPARIVCLHPETERPLSLTGEPEVVWEYVFAGGDSPKASAIVPAMIEDTPVVLVSASHVSGGASGQILALDANTGAEVWASDVPAYDGTAVVCDISTPVVNNGWVYFLVSEFITGTGNVHGTYGRAWAIDLETGGTARWVFPDSAIGEPQRALPCFNDPLWVAAVGSGSGSELPPLPTGAPVITPGATLEARLTPGGETMRRARVDALMTFGTPVTHTAQWNEGAGRWDIAVEAWVDWDNRGGGSEFALVPTPTSGAGAGVSDYRLNTDYYGVLFNGERSDITWVGREPAGEGAMIPLAFPDITDAESVHFSSVNASNTGARQFLARWYDAPLADDDLMDLMRGCEIIIEYADAGQPDERYFLPGPILWQRQYRPNEARMGGGVARGDALYAPTIPPINWAADPPETATDPAPWRTSLIHVLDPESGAVRWRIDPRVALPAATGGMLGTRDAQAMMLAPPAADDGVLVAGVTMWPVGGGATMPPRRSAVVGLKDSARLQIRLGQTQALDDGIGISRQPGAVVMFLLETYDIPPVGAGATKMIPRNRYEIDYASRIIRMLPEYADDVGVEATNGPDPIAGKAVVVEWTDTDGNTRTELHVFEPAHVFSYVPDFIRLEHYPVDLASVRVYLPTKSNPYAVPVRFPGGAFAAAGEPTVTFNYGSGNSALLPNGWLDMQGAYADAGGTQWDLEPGTDVVIAYTGFAGRTVDWSDAGAYGGTNGFVPIPNPGLGLAAERRQIPVHFGQSFTTPTVAGGTILLGTEGYDPAWTGDPDAPPGATPPPYDGRAETLLALNWDRQSGYLWGRMLRPAWADMTGDDVPVVGAPPTTVGHDAVVASRVWGTGAGYVSSLRTERTLIAAGSRIVECVGAEPVREWVGSRDGATRSRPFGHIAKATRLDNGNILVVDSGNNRVFELDAQGRQVWPLTAGGAAIIPTNAPAKMLLNRPTDAWRYYTWQYGVRWSHTVIADAGNRRIVHWVTKPASATDPAQSHEAYVVSPDVFKPDRETAERLDLRMQPGQLLELEYQKAQPILDPETGALWGYLASAANWNTPLIVEPPRFDSAGNFYPARINPPGGAVVLGARMGDPGAPPAISAGATWAPWDVVYQLEFRNIRQVEFTRRANDAAFGSPDAGAYFWVVASRYMNLPDQPMGVYEFALEAAAPLTFWFTRNDYLASGQGTFTLPSGQLFHKEFFPTSAKRLPTEDYIIANQAGLVDHLTVENVDMLAWGRVVGSEVFRVSVLGAGKMVYGRHMIPDPRRPEWPEPLGMVSYAERF